MPNTVYFSGSGIIRDEWQNNTGYEGDSTTVSSAVTQYQFMYVFIAAYKMDTDYAR